MILQYIPRDSRIPSGMDSGVTWMDPESHHHGIVDPCLLAAGVRAMDSHSIADRFRSHDLGIRSHGLGDLEYVPMDPRSSRDLSANMATSASIDCERFCDPVHVRIAPHVFVLADRGRGDATPCGIIPDASPDRSDPLPRAFHDPGGTTPTTSPLYSNVSSWSPHSA
jgi:hypothetical protein